MRMLAPVMIVDSFLGKCLMDRIPPSYFVRMVEGIILIFGVWFLCKP